MILDAESGACLHHLRSLTIRNSGAKSITNIPIQSFKRLQKITLIHVQCNTELFDWLDAVLFCCLDTISRIEIEGFVCSKEKKAVLLAKLDSLNFHVQPIAPRHFVWTKNSSQCQKQCI